MLNIATPESAFKWWKLPVKGVGLARMEFIISNNIKIHPMALVHPEKIEDEDLYRKIRKLTRGYTDLRQYFIDHLERGISKIAASRYPDPVIVRTSDFKTNEYAQLIGGTRFEPKEENPMLGWRGASRYYSDGYREDFALECKAFKKVREQIRYSIYSNESISVNQDNFGILLETKSKKIRSIRNVYLHAKQILSNAVWVYTPS